MMGNHMFCMKNTSDDAIHGHTLINKLNLVSNTSLYHYIVFFRKMSSNPISEQQILTTVLTAVGEAYNCAFPCQDVTEADLEYMMSNRSDIDIDYLMMREECSKMMSSTIVLEFFIDGFPEFFPRPALKMYTVIRSKRWQSLGK